MRNSIPESNPLAFRSSHDQPFSTDLFQSPSSEYRGAPLWSWNCKLEKDELLRQIDVFQEMGLGGFHMHSRSGLDTPYLGPEFMGLVNECVKHAASKAPPMLACLYDEDKWPSGTAGGLVLKDHLEFRTKHLLISRVPYGVLKNPQASKTPLGTAVRSEDGELIAKFSLSWNDAGAVSYKRLPLDAPSSLTTWYVYVESNPPSEGHNGETYVDTLNPAAIKRFISTTHEVYHQAVGKEFGNTVPSIFTDEPQFAHKGQFLRSDEDKDVFLPWTVDLPNTFLTAYGFDILDSLPEILLDTIDIAQGNPSLTRYLYHEHVCERFVAAFMDQIASWCQQHGIALMGHMMQEPTLRSQTESLGEAMRCYRNLDVPGIDILHDAVEYNTAKQASSVSKQRNGARGVTMSELYGVTNWTFDFTGYKGSGDWQAALGISFRVPHLTPVTIAGEGKRDYPAAIGYQAPWYKEWKFIEDHFARVNYALTRGKASTKVAVIHPIESFWLCFGPLDRNRDEQIHRMDNHDALSDWLLHSMIDFDFISESLFADQTDLASIKSGSSLPVGQCLYEAVIVPNLKTIRSSTLARLKAFASAGGTVIIAGEQPKFVNAQLPKEPISFSGFRTTPFSRYDIIRELAPQTEVSVTEHWGTKGQTFLYQLRDDGEDRYLFVCNEDRKKEYTTEVAVRGRYDVVVLDTLSGEEWPLNTSINKDGWTQWPWTFDGAGSLLVRLGPRKEAIGRDQTIYRKSFREMGSVKLESVSLSEPNVLMLDRATFCVTGGDGEWKPTTEILRIDNLVREQLHLPLKTEAFRQPWSQPDSARDIRGELHMRFEFENVEDIPGPIELAIEDLSTLKIRLDGDPVSNDSSGWWVDKKIEKTIVKTANETLVQGKHLLEIDMPFGLLTMVERVYLLGNFFVELRGTAATLRKMEIDSLSFGDWTRQGLPFYAGNVVYNTSFELAEQTEVAVDLPHYEGPIVTVVLDGDETSKKHLSLHPSYAYAGRLGAGRHELQFTSYGNRENAFGTVHLPSGKTHWHGPNAWRYQYDWWMEEYNVKPMGLIQAPRVKIPGEDVVTIRRSKVQRWYN